MYMCASVERAYYEARLYSQCFVAAPPLSVSLGVNNKEYPASPAGSITAGTPVLAHLAPDKRPFDYFKRRSPAGAGYPAPPFSPVSLDSAYSSARILTLLAAF